MTVLDDETRRFGRLLHYVGVLATVICAVAGYSLLHAPTLQEVAHRSARINELKLLLENEPVVRAQHRKVSDQLSKVEKRIAEVQRRVPHDPNAGEFLKELTQLASAEQLVIKDFSPEQSQIKDGYAEMEVTLNGEGSFASICGFVDRLAKLNRLSKIKNLTLSAVDIGDEYPMTATLVIYFGLQRKEMTSAQEGRRG